MNMIPELITLTPDQVFPSLTWRGLPSDLYKELTETRAAVHRVIFSCSRSLIHLFQLPPSVLTRPFSHRQTR